MATELRVLGQVELRVDGRLVEVGHARQRCVLAVLLVEANRGVTMEQLLERVWADRLPFKARQVASNYVSRLRRVLAGEVAVVRRGGVYMLEVDPEAVDLHRFRHLVQQARGREDARALALLEEAVGLWRGEPFAGLDTPWLAAVRTGLEQEHVAARLDRIDLALRCGRHTEVLPELFTLADRDALDERVAAQLLLALHRAGRTSDALARYRRLRTRLVADLGTEPGNALRDLHQRILAADPTLNPPPAAISDGTAAKAEQPVPRQLPAPPRWFTGRNTELAGLGRALTAEPDQDPLPGGTGVGARGPATVMISAIGGSGGIGKTWLALAWAHQHAGQFPDGQLFVDLHGFSPTQDPMTPEAAVRRFLNALGVDSGRIPTDLDAQAALYRSVVAGKRMLVVLDNAATADQVVPLLPGSPSCTVLVTGRTRLASLIDRHCARHLQLDILARAESLALLTARLGAERVAAEPGAVDELVKLCGGYPLALSITARTAATRPGGVPLAEVAAELRDLGLGMLDDENDPAASLPTVLSWSLRRLTDEQRTVFGLLGIAPGPDTTLPAAVALTGLPEADTRKALHALEGHSLLVQHSRGRYSMHDLIRAYAVSACDRLPEPKVQAAQERVVDFYLYTAHTADQLLDSSRDPIRLDPPAPGTGPQPLTDQSAALAWLDAHHRHLLAAQHAAATQRRHQIVWRLAWVLHTFHWRRGHRHDELTVWQIAAEAGSHLSDPAVLARIHRRLGYAHAGVGRHTQAVEHLHHALALAEQHHELTQQAHTHSTLGRMWARRGDHQRALEHARRALDLYRVLDQPAWQALALNQVGWHTAQLGNYDTARNHCRAALALHREHGDLTGEATALDGLGLIEHRTGNHHEAIHHYRQALALRRGLGNITEIAETLDRLGHSYTALDHPEQARAVWREALGLYRGHNRDADALRVQRQLDALGPTMDPNGPPDASKTTDNA
ncbi:AfsR/SARP family transcriptional regulator [Amycolatopsis kentuckyensis]|uniref:AfsR/SARP family transcriptional regulator n=1 Tax=Amycolatopsis kentuckyensis TaxID=218823 RepID=UPI000A384E30|nr:BTAD domain-containing putative transcriptional regulator [Amycolatopsis kentuckyensis]